MVIAQGKKKLPKAIFQVAGYIYSTALDSPRLEPRCLGDELNCAAKLHSFSYKQLHSVMTEFCNVKESGTKLHFCSMDDSVLSKIILCSGYQKRLCALCSGVQWLSKILDEISPCSPILHNQHKSGFGLQGASTGR